jgi:hypothetical protein
MYPETAIVFIFWLASLVFCFYGKAWVDDREEGKALRTRERDGRF